MICSAVIDWIDTQTAEMLVNCGRKYQKTATTMATENSGGSTRRATLRQAGRPASVVTAVPAVVRSSPFMAPPAMRCPAVWRPERPGDTRMAAQDLVDRRWRSGSPTSSRQATGSRAGAHRLRTPPPGAVRAGPAPPAVVPRLQPRGRPRERGERRRGIGQPGVVGPVEVLAEQRQPQPPGHAVRRPRLV